MQRGGGFCSSSLVTLAPYNGKRHPQGSSLPLVLCCSALCLLSACSPPVSDLLVVVGLGS